MRTLALASLLAAAGCASYHSVDPKMAGGETARFHQKPTQSMPPINASGCTQSGPCDHTGVGPHSN